MDPIEPHQVASGARSSPGAWLELFYDLVFVAAILVFSSAISHAGDPVQGVWIVGAFIAVWWIWLSTTMFANRYRVDDTPHRLLVLSQMFLVALVAMETRESVFRDEAWLSLTYALLQATVAVMYARESRGVGVRATFARRRMIGMLVAAAIFVVAAPVPGGGRPLLWIVGLMVTIVPAVMQFERWGDAVPIDEGHLADRMGALTIIVCGEAFVKVAVTVADGSIDRVDVVALAFQFVLTFALWWAYFDDIPGSGIVERLLPAWATLHLVAQLCIAATAIGVAQFVKEGLADALPAAEILEVMAALAALYVALALLGLCTRRRPQRALVTLRLATASAVVVVGLGAWLVPWIDLIDGVALLTAVSIAHAVVATRLRAGTAVVARV